MDLLPAPYKTRKARFLEEMKRICWNLGDEQAQKELYEYPTSRTFAQLDGAAIMPDETTILRFSFPPFPSMPAAQPSMPQRSKPCTLHFSTWFFCWLLACALMLMCGRASAQLADDAVQRGAAWLQAQVLASGHLTGEDASPALPAQARFETALTLHTLEHEVPPALLAALEEAAEEAQEQATEYLAYRALAAQLGAGSDDVAIQALLAMQGADGGFGTGKGGASNALDTAWALRALSAGDEAAQALAWLVSVQQADGSWALAPEGVPGSLKRHITKGAVNAEIF